MSGIPEIDGETSPNFKRIIVDGVFGHIDSIGLQVIMYSQHSIIDKALESEPIASNRAKIKRIAECELIMSPMQLKSVCLWLEQKVKEYETLFGKIPSPEEVQARARNLNRPDSQNT